MKNSRRNFLKNLSLTALASVPLSASSSVLDQSNKLNVLCIGAHPDDPESGCGGTLSKLSSAGHNVKVAYLTRGEAGVEGKSHKEAADIRTKEAMAGCMILGAEPVFLGQVDGDTIVNSEWISKVSKLIESEKPDLVFTHWPIDSHRDHQAAAILVTQAWLRSEKKFKLYYFEVCAGEQSMGFHPTDYVDISKEQETKRKALYCHLSQDPKGIYECGHAIMEKFRGREFGVGAAEAFIYLNYKNAGAFPF